MEGKKYITNYPKQVQKSEWSNHSWLVNDLSQSMILTTPVNSLIHFRDIPLYPTIEDIKSKPPTLCANKVKQRYKNCEEYLDRFFRLMREDFTSSVRDAICFLKKPNKTENERFEMQKLWHYKNVQIQKTNATSLKTMFFCFETATKALQFDYESSKRFKNGALLILTKDNYETFSLGIITDTFRLNRGIVGVDVVDFKEVNKWTHIDILEPSAFYEPYRYVLGVFQDMCEMNFPMKNYIIYGWKQISPPKYLINNSTYKINGIVFNILNNDQWPTAKSLQMDINQYEALKGALTKEFTMIQGPPGTGKTYIGLEIVKIIIENMYKTKKLTSPILVVCMTNHALDQFLEGIWRTTKNIARFGLNTKSEILVNLVPCMSRMGQEVNKFKSFGYLELLKNKFVVGMTTTVAAKKRCLLKNLKCPIVIVEEAAEVLEPHIVAALSEHCKHLILIGDHKQLRPQTANHIMGQKYKLDVSLFERMVHNDIPSYILAEQHRMRPEIAGLVAPAIYQHLRNHPSVLNRPHIRGVASDVFCITHKANEEKNIELSSFKNSLEGDFLVALADYLLKQGYYTEDITIMAMYNAQVVYITKLINNPPYEHLKEIRVSSVDGYQGEENEIVLLSLVRSNSYNSVGFLKTNNRVCVALSRARVGFYIAGNLDLLSRSSKLWESIKKYLCKMQAIGPKLKLRCTTHNNLLGEVSNAAHFKHVGSCKSVCDGDLPCGHKCTTKCHTDDIDHLQVKCLYRCTRSCSRNHKCKNMCYEECKNCTVFTRELGECGHFIEGQCHIFNQIKCNVKVKVTLECGHEIEKLCHEPRVCNKACEKLVPGCLFRHACKNKCGQVCGPCTAPIPIVMYCGHTSQVLCSQETNSAVCKTKVSRQLPCGHQAMVSCTEDVLNFECHDKSHKNDNAIKQTKSVVLLDYTNVQPEEIVKNKIIFPCGHKGHLNVPNDSSINENSNPEVLAKYCDKICSKKRECGHYCKAMCKDCPSKKQHKACHSCKRKKAFSLNTISSIKFRLKDKKLSKKMIVDEVSNY